MSLTLGPAARRWGSSGGGGVLIGGLPLYTGLPGRVGARECIGRLRSVRRRDLGW